MLIAKHTSINTESEEQSYKFPISQKLLSLACLKTYSLPYPSHRHLSITTTLPQALCMSETTIWKGGMYTKWVLTETIAFVFSRGKNPELQRLWAQHCLLQKESLPYLSAIRTLTTSCFMHSWLPSWDN